jgi:hypothetical protein
LISLVRKPALAHFRHVINGFLRDRFDGGPQEVRCPNPGSPW